MLQGWLRGWGDPWGESWGGVYSEQDDTVVSTLGRPALEEDDVLSAHGRAFFVNNILEQNDRLTAEASLIIHATSAPKLRSLALIKEQSDSLSTTTVSTRLPALSSLSQFEEEDTVISSAIHSLKATVARSEGNDTIAANTRHGIKSITNRTENNDTVTGHTRNQIKGFATLSEKSDTSASTSKTKLHASAASIEEHDSFISYARHSVTAQAVSNEADDLVVSASKIYPAAILNVYEGADNLTVTGSSKIKGRAQVSETSDISSFVARPTIVANAISTDVDDKVAATCITPHSANSENLEGNDTFVSTAIARIRGRVTTIDSDSLTFNAITRARANFQVTEGDDSFVSEGDLITKGHVVFTEGPDVLYHGARVNITEDDDTLYGYTGSAREVVIVDVDEDWIERSIGTVKAENELVTIDDHGNYNRVDPAENWILVSVAQDEAVSSSVANSAQLSNSNTTLGIQASKQAKVITDAARPSMSLSSKSVATGLSNGSPEATISSAADTVSLQGSSGAQSLQASTTKGSLRGDIKRKILNN